MVRASSRARGFASIKTVPGASGPRRRLEAAGWRVRKVHLIVLSPIALRNVQIRNRSSNFVLNLSFHPRCSVGRRVVVFVCFRRPLRRRSRRWRSSLIVLASSPILRRVRFTASAEAAVLITTSVGRSSSSSISIIRIRIIIIITLAMMVPTVPEFSVAAASPTLAPTRSLWQVVLLLFIRHGI